jgi:hypothetical protein
MNMRPNFEAISVIVRRCRPNVVEYSVIAPSTSGSDYPNRVDTYHANRSATFFGPHTGNGNARQIGSMAKTLWRPNDATLRSAFRRAFPNAEISI